MKKCVIDINVHLIIFVIHNLIYLHRLQRLTFQNVKINHGLVVHRQLQLHFLIKLEILDTVRLFQDSSSASNHLFFLVGCQTRLSLPPAADLDSLIQSFASNSDPDDPPITVSNSSLNISQIRRKLFSDDDDLLDETPLIAAPRRSSSFGVRKDVLLKMKTYVGIVILA